MSRYCPIDQPQHKTHGSTTEGFSHLNLRIQVFFRVFRCVFGFEETVDVFESLIIKQTLKLVAVHCHSHILICTVEQCGAVFAPSKVP